MKEETKINELWEQFRDSVDQAYAQGKRQNSADGHAECNALRDYARDQSWHDDMAKLLGRETANERKHRNGAPYRTALGVGAASKLILMNQAAFGSGLPQMPPATIFLTCRDTAAEAEVIGYLAKGFISQIWRDELSKLDYAKLMRGGQ